MSARSGIGIMVSSDVKRAPQTATTNRRRQDGTEQHDGRVIREWKVAPAIIWVDIENLPIRNDSCVTCPVLATSSRLVGPATSNLRCCCLFGTCVCQFDLQLSTSGGLPRCPMTESDVAHFNSRGRIRRSGPVLGLLS